MGVITRRTHDIHAGFMHAVDADFARDAAEEGVLRAAKQKVRGAGSSAERRSLDVTPPPDAPATDDEEEEEVQGDEHGGDATLQALTAALRSCHVPLPATPGSAGRGPRSGVQVAKSSKPQVGSSDAVSQGMLARSQLVGGLGGRFSQGLPACLQSKPIEATQKASSDLR
jgi:hypothetical protein